MEVLLPVALKVFPNMLPSTFEDKLKVSSATASLVKHVLLGNTSGTEQRFCAGQPTSQMLHCHILTGVYQCSMNFCAWLLTLPDMGVDMH